MLMKLNRKIINQCISVLMLVIYLFSSLSILSSHNHNEEHHHHDLPICENLDSYSLNISDCSHASHVISSKESCAICDYFSNCKPVVLDISIKTALELVTVNEIQLFTSLYIIDANNTRNKSPPFFI